MEVAKLVLQFVEVLSWPVVVIVAIVLFRGEVKGVFRRLSGAKLPGGVALDFGEAVAEAKELSLRVEARTRPADRPKRPDVPQTEANARMLSLGLQPSPSGLDLTYYEDLARRDPNLALAGVRIELEILGRNLARGFGHAELADSSSMNAVLRGLLREDAIDETQAELAQRVLSICNRAVHGAPVSYSDAVAVINITRVLADDYLDWLGWGFPDEWSRG